MADHVGASPADYAKFLSQNLGPTFSSSSITTRIMLGTMSNGDNGATKDKVTDLSAQEFASDIDFISGP